jgi:hypothetical protein
MPAEVGAEVGCASTPNGMRRRTIERDRLVQTILRRLVIPDEDRSSPHPWPIFIWPRAPAIRNPTSRPGACRHREL